ncbi:MAG: DUF4234 domain-containing protein [candidate division Zixibacteria bacterium]|nr:DUF4234 domain-containing protein [candidate division Zixibacteria bacterium]
MANGVKKRNMVAQVGLCLITLGIYVIYWFYQTACELKYLAGKDSEARPSLWTVLLFVPFGAFYSQYKYSELYERVSTEPMNRWLLFVLWLVFPFAVWFIVQTELNRRATY